MYRPPASRRGNQAASASRAPALAPASRCRAAARSGLASRAAARASPWEGGSGILSRTRPRPRAGHLPLVQAREAGQAPPGDLQVGSHGDLRGLGSTEGRLDPQKVDAGRLPLPEELLDPAQLTLQRRPLALCRLQEVPLGEHLQVGGAYLSRHLHLRHLPSRTRHPLPRLRLVDPGSPGPAVPEKVAGGEIALSEAPVERRGSRGIESVERGHHHGLLEPGEVALHRQRRVQGPPSLPYRARGGRMESLGLSHRWVVVQSEGDGLGKGQRSGGLLAPGFSQGDQDRQPQDHRGSSSMASARSPVSSASNGHSSSSSRVSKALRRECTAWSSADRVGEGSSARLRSFRARAVDIKVK